MSNNQLLNSIKNNLLFLEISTKDKTIKDIIKELNNETKNEGLALETILKINLYLKGGK